MNGRHYLLLAGLGLAVAVFVAAFQPAPGYMDADYYYAGGLQLVEGHGFSEPYLWNYLDDPAGLPHPSHAYWMPLASLLAAAGALLFGPESWSAARVGFLATAAAVPPLTAALAWSFASRRPLALTSGLLAVFSVFYLPFLTTTDTFGVYMLLGGAFFLVVSRKSSAIQSLLLGLIAGLMHLARADGLLWLWMALLAVTLTRPSRRWSLTFYSLLIVLLGYLLVMLPWFIRNWVAFGAPLAPGGSRMLWLTSYNQLFSYPASQLTLASWWQSGLGSILKVRLWALGLNLATALSVQGEVVLLPLIGLGGWFLRKDRRVQLGGSAWLLTLLAMTFAFPLAGARGGFFHSGAALQPFLWALAPIGLDRLIEWGKRKRGWDEVKIGKVLRPALVGLAALMTAVIVWARLWGGVSGQAWGQESAAYGQMNAYLILEGLTADDVVMAANAPGYYLASGNPTIAVPDENIDTLLAVARRYGARYLILEQDSLPADLVTVYENPQQPDLDYLGEVEHARLFRIRF